MAHRPVTAAHAVDPNDPDAVEFYRWLGLCVGNWAFIDRRLYQIFHHAVGFEHKQSAFLYYRQRAFNQRLRMVDESLKMAFPAAQYKEQWSPLREKIEGLSHTRNIFAHHPARRESVEKDGSSKNVYSIYIEPFERVLNSDYPGLLGKTALDVADLHQHDLDAGQLELELRYFARTVEHWRAKQRQPAKSGEQNPAG